MHPVRAGYGSVVVGLHRAIRQGGSLGPRESVLRPGRQLTVPVDERLLAALICQIDTEPLMRAEPDARASIWSDEAVDSCCAAIDLQRSRSSDQTLPGVRRGAPRRGQCGENASGEGAGEEGATGEL